MGVFKRGLFHLVWVEGWERGGGEGLGRCCGRIGEGVGEGLRKSWGELGFVYFKSPI